MTAASALAGLRVVDFTDESGRLAGKVLAQLGAEVVRLKPGVAGRPLKTVAGGVLEWWFDAGTTRVALDLDDERDRERARGLVAGADVLLEAASPGELARAGLDAAELRRLNPRLVHVSLSPFGGSGPRAAWQASDLVTAALGGLLSVCGSPEKPLNPWGRQWFNAGGLYAVIAALAGVHAVRTLGSTGMHFDLSLQHCAVSCSEQLLMYWLHMGHVPERRKSLHWTGLYDVLPCGEGYAMLTPAPTVENLLAWLQEDGMAGSLGENPPQHALEWAARGPEVMQVLRAWAATKAAGELFLEGQRRNLSFGQVRSVADCAVCPQHGARAYFAPHRAAALRAPRLPFRFERSEEVLPAAPAPPRAAGEIEARWRAAGVASGRGGSAGGLGSGVAGAAGPSSARPLAGIRVLDFTWVLAGPQATRVFADLGADVIKLQTEERAQGANHNEFPFFLMWNRGKRSAGLNMKHAGARDVFRKLLASADVVIDNFAPGVLDRWGIGWDAIHGWNPRVIQLAMSGCGSDGPWRDFVTFAPTIQALSGLTYLSNPPGEGDVGIGVSLNDHVSGLFGAVALLAALEERRGSGVGQFIDLSQLEVGTYLAGPALVQYLDGGPEAQPIGNADAFEDHVPNEVYACAEGGWLAVTARDDGEWQRLCAAIGAADLAVDAELATGAGRARRRDEVDARLSRWAAGQGADAAMHRLQAAGVPAGRVQNAQDLTEADDQLAARRWLHVVEHATMGAQRHDAFPAWLDGRDLAPTCAPPILGQHSFEIYRDLAGMTDEEIAAGIADGLFV